MRSASTISKQSSLAIDLWRRLIIRRVLLVGSLILGFATIATAREAIFSAEGLRLPVALGLATGVVATAFFWKGLALGYQFATVVLSLGGGSYYAMRETGYLLPNPLVASVSLIVVATLVLGRRGAVVVGTVVLVGMTLLAYSHVSEPTPIDTNRVNINDPMNWVRVIAISTTIIAGTTATVAFMMSKFQAALERSDELLADLTRESGEKIAILEANVDLERQLRQAQKLEAIGLLAGGVAHDFNNLLTAIIGNTELLRRAPEHTLKYSAEILEAADRAQALTSQLLAFSKHEAMNRGPIDFSKTISLSIPLVTRLLSRDVEAQWELQESGDFITAAKSDIDMLVMNLCLNANDAMPNGGTLHVSTRAIEREGVRRVVLEVRDTGAGMTEEQLEKIFDPFFTTKTSGTGLGLSLVDKVVRVCDGDIAIKSKLGEGTTFTATFPVLSDPPKEEACVLPAEMTSGTECVLLVDDNPAVRRVTRRLLESVGYRVIECSGGLDALAQFSAQGDSIDLLVTDSVMPGMSGAELIDTLAMSKIAVPTLLFSGYSSSIPSEFLNNPRHGYIAKPFHEDQSLLEIRRLLDRDD